MGLFTQDELTAAVPESIQLLALDDDADNAADSGLFEKVLADAETWIGGYLEQAGLALADYVTNKRLKHLGIRYAEYSLWNRRGQAERTKKIYDEWIKPGMTWLEKVASGAETLTAAAQGGSAASVITEPARTYDAAGRLMT